MPDLIDFYERHRGDDRFRILAFHDASVKTLAELDGKIAERGLVKEYWKGRTIPFPILLDATGTTIAQFGIRAFPTTILVDPEGRLVGMASIEELEKKLSAMPAEGRGRRGI